MTLALVLACLWVVAATVVAFLPMRFQILPGLALLAAAPVLIWMLAHETNVWIGLGATAAAVSMFRLPLIYFVKKATSNLRDRRKGPPK